MSIEIVTELKEIWGKIHALQKIIYESNELNQKNFNEIQNINESVKSMQNDIFKIKCCCSEILSELENEVD